MELEIWGLHQRQVTPSYLQKMDQTMFSWWWIKAKKIGIQMETCLPLASISWANCTDIAHNTWKPKEPQCVTSELSGFLLSRKAWVKQTVSLRQVVQEGEVGIGMAGAPWKIELCIIGLQLGLRTDKPQQDGASAPLSFSNNFSGMFHVLNTQTFIWQGICSRQQATEASLLVPSA